jgi:cyclopropane fatty-acyl-phospholipid synthase-like methyltransferase
MHEPSDRLSIQLTPQFENVQAHYDLSDDFYRLFLDPNPDRQLRVLRAG